MKVCIYIYIYIYTSAPCLTHFRKKTKNFVFVQIRLTLIFSAFNAEIKSRSGSFVFFCVI